MLGGAARAERACLRRAARVGMEVSRWSSRKARRAIQRTAGLSGATVALALRPVDCTGCARSRGKRPSAPAGNVVSGETAAQDSPASTKMRRSECRSIGARRRSTCARNGGLQRSGVATQGPKRRRRNARSARRPALPAASQPTFQIGHFLLQAAREREACQSRCPPAERGRASRRRGGDALVDLAPDDDPLPLALGEAVPPVRHAGQEVGELELLLALERAAQGAWERSGRSASGGARAGQLRVRADEGGAPEVVELVPLARRRRHAVVRVQVVRAQTGGAEQRDCLGIACGGREVVEAGRAGSPSGARARLELPARRESRASAAALA